jgi:hypothetical protein
MKAGDPSLVYHVEAGIKIHDLYTTLDNFVDPVIGQARPLALLTMGGSSGQTLVGAVSTGTHGGDKFLPPIADSVLAMHLVGSGGVQYWIEPSNGITDPARLRQYVVPTMDPHNIVYDDAIFDSAIVSLGCFGVVCAVVIKVRDQYDLIETTTATTWRNFVLNAHVQLNDPSSRFLQVILDPYTDDNNDNSCLITTRAESNLSTAGQCTSGNLQQAALSLLFDAIAAAPLELLATFSELVQQIQLSNFSIDQTLVQAINIILQQAPQLRSVLTRDYFKIVGAAWPAGTCGGKSWQVMDTGLRGAPSTDIGGYSIEMFFPASDVTTGALPFVNFVNSVIASVNSATNTFLAGYIALRFTGPTRAYLGMQQWIPTCSVEISTLPGVQGELALLTDILDMCYRYGGLPHWGQMIDLDIQGRGNLYPRYAQWRQAYAAMSDNFMKRTFENSLSTRWQLTSP